MSAFYQSRWDRPYLTPSLAVTLLQRSPLHAKLRCPYYVEPRNDSTPAMVEGTVVDCLMMGREFTGVVLPFDDLRTKAAQEARDAAIAANRDWITRKAFERCSIAAAALQAQALAHPYGSRARANGVLQRRLFWGDDPACSTEPDIWIPDDKTVLDVKRTAVVPNAMNWRRHVSTMMYAVQVAATLEATGGKAFGWLVIEANPPHCAVLHWATDLLIESGARLWAEAKERWHQCVETDSWPGYEDGEIDPMPWDINAEAETVTFTE